MSDTGRYMRISFWGSARAHEKYTRLQRMCEEAAEWLLANEHWQEGHDLLHWFYGSGGFVREHTPWYVILTMDEWKMLAKGLRRGENSNADYCWVRLYGTRV